MKKIIVLGLLIIGIPVLGALRPYVEKAITPTATSSYTKFNIPTYNVNYNKFNQNIIPATTYRNISSFNQQQISGYKPAITNQPNMEQARQLVEQAKQSNTNMMKKYAAAKAYSTSTTQQSSSWLNRLLLWLGIGTAVATYNYVQANEEEALHKKHQAPAELSNILDPYYEDIKKCLQSNKVCKCPDNLPCYIKKRDVMRRIKNLDKLHSLIAQEHLDEIILPEKYIWRDYVVAEELTPIKNKNGHDSLDGITKKQLQQLLIVAKKGKFSDFIGSAGIDHPNAYLIQDHPGKNFWVKQSNQLNQDNAKKIAIIDTKRFFFILPNFGADNPKFLWKLLTKEKSSSCKYYKIWRDYSTHGQSFDQFWNKWEPCFK